MGACPRKAGQVRFLLTQLLPQWGYPIQRAGMGVAPHCLYLPQGSWNAYWPSLGLSFHVYKRG